MKRRLLLIFLALAGAACAPAAPIANRGLALPPASSAAAHPMAAPAETPPEAESSPDDTAPRRTSPLSPAEAMRALADLGTRALTALERGDAEAFARVAHPERGLDAGVMGSVSHHLAARDVGSAFRDAVARPWDGRSNAAEHPLSMSYRDFFTSLRDRKYTSADLVGYNEVVQEDGLCGGACVAEEIAEAFPGAPFIQYAYASGTDANPGMWRFLVVAFERDATGWRVIGLLEDSWSP